MAPFDSGIGRYTTIGAAYLAVVAMKLKTTGTNRNDR